VLSGRKKNRTGHQNEQLRNKELGHLIKLKKVFYARQSEYKKFIRPMVKVVDHSGHFDRTAR
jgi:hypothetical protein